MRHLSCILVFMDCALFETSTTANNNNKCEFDQQTLMNYQRFIESSNALVSFSVN